MPHQCVRCNAFYEDGSKQLLDGCTFCKGKFFFFLKKEIIPKAQELTAILTEKDKRRMERDVMKIMGNEFEDTPIVLKLENIKVLQPGKFEINLVDLFHGRPLVYKLEEGKYFIDIPATFQAKDFGLSSKGSSRNPLDDTKLDSQEENT